jgi:hypothetical protein
MPTGETNGKSNNLNHCLTKVIYKDYYPTNSEGPKIPKTEVWKHLHCSRTVSFAEHVVDRLQTSASALQVGNVPTGQLSCMSMYNI